MDALQVKSPYIKHMNKRINKLLVCCQIDRLFRFFNRDSVLVIMYHGVCRKDYSPPVWTQLPEEKFVEQVKFLKSNYNLLTMKEFIGFLRGEREIPERSALITFDDGLRNNFSVAFPILSKYHAPATVFLTMDYVGTDKILWFDALFLLLRKASTDEIDCSAIDEIFQETGNCNFINEKYYHIVEKMKRFTEIKRSKIMSDLRSLVSINSSDFLEDFGFLTWEQIKNMKETDLIDFGVHTANHRILTNLNPHEWESEISEPKKKLSQFLGEELVTFCYPNGEPQIDFNDLHEEFLKACGYECAFSTEISFYNKKSGKYRIGRFHAGNNMSSDYFFFRLYISGAIKKIKTILGKK